MLSQVVATAKGLQGPEIYWGPSGVTQGYEESDIKGYEKFDKSAARVAFDSKLIHSNEAR